MSGSGALARVMSFAALVVGALAWTVPSAGAITVLIPVVVERAAPDDKVFLLALVVSIGAGVGIVSALAAGTLSDVLRQTRGTRAPVMLAGALVAGVAFFALADAHEVPSVLLAWVAAEIGVNAVGLPLRATIAERFSPTSRATAFAVYGVATLGGLAIGTAVASAFIHEPARGFLTMAPVIIVGTGLCTLVLAATRTDNRSAWPQPRRPLPPLPRPTTSRGYFLVLGGQFGVAIAITSITTYQLYILTDYVGLPTAEAGRMVAVVAGVNAISSVLAGLVVGRLSDRLGRRTPFLLGATALLLAGCVTLLLVPGVGGGLAFALLAGLGGGAYFAAAPALATETIRSPESYGRDLGIVNIASAGGRVGAPAFGSLVITAVGFVGLFAAAAGLLVVAGALYSRVSPPRQDTVPGTL